MVFISTEEALYDISICEQNIVYKSRRGSFCYFLNAFNINGGINTF